MDNEIAIKVEHVSKTFKLPHEKQSSIKGALIGLAKGGKRTFEKQEALKDISFEIKKGEFFGIVGRNGSGKSTLLKMLAGIYMPTEGEIQVNGKLTPFIELGVGFSPELTGRENVFLNGALLGFSRTEMNTMYDEIVDFAELERFMDQKLKNYSSGMQVRLAFSIAIRAQSNILILDEVLAVGDADFQQKCYNYFNALKSQGSTVVLVTHDMSAVRRFCNRGILINKGKIEKIGEPDEIAEIYETLNLRNAEKRLTKNNTKTEVSKYKKRETNGAAEIIKVETFNTHTNKSQNTFMAEEKIGVRITYQAHEKISEPAIGFIFQDEQNITVFATNNIVRKIRTQNLKNKELLIAESVVDNIFTNGEYSITCAIESTDLATIYDRIEHIHSFLIGGHPLPHARAHPEHSLSFTYQA